MATDQEMDAIMRVVEERMAEREAAVKVFEERRREMRDMAQDVQQIAVAALRDAELQAVASLVNDRLRKLADTLYPKLPLDFGP